MHSCFSCYLRLLIQQFFITARVHEHRSVSVRARHDPLSPLSEHLHNTITSPRTDALWESGRCYNTVRMHLRERWTIHEKFLFLSFSFCSVTVLHWFCVMKQYCERISLSGKNQWTSIFHQLPSTTLLAERVFELSGHWSQREMSRIWAEK